jgi:four helix bundle protein
MLNIYAVIVELLVLLRSVLGKVEKHDSDLGKQMRRAASSILLNVGEGSGSFGGNQRLRYRTALGSAKETMAGIDAAEALGYITVDPEVRRKLRHIIGTLTKLSL